MQICDLYDGTRSRQVSSMRFFFAHAQATSSDHYGQQQPQQQLLEPDAAKQLKCHTRTCQVCEERDPWWCCFLAGTCCAGIAGMHGNMSRVPPAASSSTECFVIAMQPGPAATCFGACLFLNDTENYLAVWLLQSQAV